MGINTGNILFVGPFSPPYNGDGIKNSYLREGFEEAGLTKVQWFDTIARSGPRWKNNLRLILSMMHANQVVFSLNCNGRYYILPIFWFLSLFTNKKGVLFVIGGSFDVQLSKYLPLWRRKVFVKILNKLDGIFAESSTLKQGLEDVGLKNVVKVYNPRKDDGSRWKLKNAIRTKGVFISRVTASKGILVLLKAIEQINNTEEKLSLDIYGPMDENYKDEVFRYIDSSNGAISYKGIVKPDRVQLLLTEYHFLVLPTFHSGEGLPGILVEAGMAGIPIIITRFNALGEYFKEDKSALFVEPENVADLRKAFRRLISDDQLAETLSEGIKKEVVPFRLESVIHQTLQLLNNYNWKV